MINLTAQGSFELARFHISANMAAFIVNVQAKKKLTNAFDLPISFHNYCHKAAILN